MITTPITAPKVFDFFFNPHFRPEFQDEEFDQDHFNNACGLPLLWIIEGQLEGLSMLKAIEDNYGCNLYDMRKDVSVTSDGIWKDKLDENDNQRDPDLYPICALVNNVTKEAFFIYHYALCAFFKDDELIFCTRVD